MKIKRVRLYQAIQLDGVSETFYDLEKLAESAKRTGSEPLVVEQTPQGLLFTGKTECVLASWNNIAFVTFEKPEQVAKKSK